MTKYVGSERKGTSNEAADILHIIDAGVATDFNSFFSGTGKGNGEAPGNL